MVDMILHYSAFQIKYVLLVLFMTAVLDLERSAEKVLAVSVIITLPVFILDVFLNISPLSEVVLVILLCIFIMKRCYNVSYISTAIAAGIEFIIFSILSYQIMTVISVWIMNNSERFTNDYINYVLLWIPIIVIMLGIIYISGLISKNYFKNRISILDTKSHLEYKDEVWQEHQQIQKTLYIVMFFVIIETLIVITVFWAKECYPFFYDQSWDFSPVLVNITIVASALILIILIRNLISLLIQERNKLLNRVQTDNIREMNSELKMQYHDFNHHLSMLNMMLKMGYIDKTREYLKGIVGEIQDIHNIPQTGSKIINALLYKKKNYARRKKVSLSVEVDSPLKGFTVDDWDLSRLIGNLITNAVEALEDFPGKKEIEVITRGDKNKNIIIIKTLGVVIEEEVQEKLFKIGFTSKEKGRGLGLFICENIVDYYQGQIIVDSKEENGYTAFIVELPAVGEDKKDENQG